MDNNGMNTENGQYTGQPGQNNQVDGQYQQPVGQQPMGQQPNYNYSQTINNYNQTLEEPMSLGEWVVSLLIMCIPCVNLIMAFVWAFGDGKKSKQNFFRAYLILLGAGIVIYVILIAVMGASIAGMVSGMANYY